MYTVGPEELAAVKRVLDKRHFFRYGGADTVAFEKEWADQIGVRTAYGVSSGTAALVTALQAMGIGPGHSVLVPAYTFISTALAVTAVGAIPIITEVDESLTLCPRDMARRIRRHTACVIPVHMQGMPCNLQAIMRVARQHRIRVLEDCCQADGGSYREKRLGSIGDMGAFSFNQYKIISCGEGGACVTSDPKLAQRAYMAQDGSCSVWPETGAMSEAFFCGGNFRFNDLNAAILREQVRKLDGILARLRRNRRQFMTGLRLPTGFRLIPSHDEKGNCGVCFLIQAPSAQAANSLEGIFRGEKVGAHRPINSGRHVYSAWGVIRGRVGGHHPDWDCFHHPRNRTIATNYDEKLKRTDDLLERTVLCHTPFDGSVRQVKATLGRINRIIRTTDFSVPPVTPVQK
jgi:dTDP-4-amino-4,6-dideoxygalactose transaminase